MKFREIIRKKKVLTIEYNPPKIPGKPNFDKIKSVSKFIDAVNVTDCPMAVLRISSIVASFLLKKEIDSVDVIFNFTCRDRNKLAISSDLLGAATLGLDNVLLINGDPIKNDVRENVYHLNTHKLIKLVKNLNNGLSISKDQLKVSTNFFIGVASNIPTKLTITGIKRRLKRKKEAGADFVITQPIYSLESLELFLESTKDINIAKMIGFFPPPSLNVAKYLDKYVKGINIPKKFIEKLEKSKDERQESFRLVEEIIESLIMKGFIHDINGIHLMRYDPSFTESVYNIIKEG